MLYPDYWVHEISRYVKLFIISLDQIPDLDWKEFFTRTFRSAFKNCNLLSGTEALASDYKLLKDPIMNPFKTLRAVQAEFLDPSLALDAFLQLNNATMQSQSGFTF